VRVQAWQLARPRPRSIAAIAAITIAVVALVLAFARPAWAHTPTASGTTSCPDENHHVAWTITNPDAQFGNMNILTATATVGGNSYAVTGYDASVAPLATTHATTIVPGDVTGTITLALHVRWDDGFVADTSATVDLQPPCHETTTSAPTTSTTATTAPTSSTGSGGSGTTSPPVTGGGSPGTGSGSAGGVQSGSQPTGSGGVAAAEAGSGTLPRTGAPSTNWALVGFASLLFGALLLAASSKGRMRFRRH
jgi:hypothetical protein